MNLRIRKVRPIHLVVAKRDSISMEDTRTAMKFGNPINPTPCHVTNTGGWESHVVTKGRFWMLTEDQSSLDYLPNNGTV